MTLSGVHLLLAALEQALIGGILHQRMLERVARLGRDSASIHEFGLFELLQGAFELRAIGTGHGGQQPMVEDAANAAPIWATSLAGESRSRRAIKESCSVDGIAREGNGPTT